MDPRDSGISAKAPRLIRGRKGPSAQVVESFFRLEDQHLTWDAIGTGSALGPKMPERCSGGGHESELGREHYRSRLPW
jgi:hypothetical protein